MRAARILIAAAMAAAMAPAAALADEYSNIHSIAIVVKTGNDITLRKLSELSFTEWEQPFPSRVDIPGTIARDIETALSPRFQIVKGTMDASRFRGLQGDELIAALREDAPTADAYVVVGLGFHSFGRIVWSGIGLDEVGDDAPQTALYTHIAMAVIDAKTGKQIDRGTGYFPGGGVFTGPQPIQICAGSLWPGSAAAMTPSQQTAIETEVIAAIRAVTPYMLDDANLPNKTGYPFPSSPGDALATGACHRP